MATDQKLTRDDLKGMSPEQIDKAAREGRIEGVSSGAEQQGGFSDGKGGVERPQEEQATPRDRRAQEPRAAMLNLDTDKFAEKLGAGAFDSVLDGATHVLDTDTGYTYEITGTNEGDLSPIVKAQDAAGDDREDLAEKLFQNWVPLTDVIHVVAQEALEDKSVKASKVNLPLKPSYAEAIQNGDLVVVDPDSRAPLCAMPTKKEQEQQKKNAEEDQAKYDANKKIAQTLGRHGHGKVDF